MEIDSSNEFPEGMYIPNPADAMPLELTHFSYRFYFRKTDEYNQKELNFFQQRNTSGELALYWENREDALLCFLYVIEDEGFFNAFRATTYKQEDSNLFVGNIYSSINKFNIIGKLIISYQEDEAILSVAYFDSEEIKQEDWLLEAGVYHFYYQMLPYEEKAIEKIGSTVSLTDYRNYSGRWYPDTMHPANGEEAVSYMDLEISADGYISGSIIDYEGTNYESAYTEFNGSIQDGTSVIKYYDDGYGHDGFLTFTFCENGIKVYIDEGGVPNKHGFPTGNNYYFR